jgi:hypothetical protein
VAAKITEFGETALFVAVYTGHEHIVKKLVDLMSKEDLAIPNNAGNIALVKVISVGNYRMAACMLRKNNNLIRARDCNDIPVNLAMGVGHIELARYLYSLTPLGDLMPMCQMHSRVKMGLCFGKDGYTTIVSTNLFFSYCFSLNFFLVLYTLRYSRLDIINIIHNLKIRDNVRLVHVISLNYKLLHMV